METGAEVAVGAVVGVAAVPQATADMRSNNKGVNNSARGDLNQWVSMYSPPKVMS